ncbi:metal-sensing transcriptional repressor [Paenibacillus sp. FSL W7-1088]|uniref:metal-sensing transcriptional repressor n=1 Tax=unclassified Paenibacillus TaxID=185978 RepID=UPI0015C65939|nr:metal-sensing transcriptional repressor [Paenibacillus sp. E222]QLG39809.1 metal-sensing transcriptional repressor [Paenibacillus sp. E222]
MVLNNSVNEIRKLVSFNISNKLVIGQRRAAVQKALDNAAKLLLKDHLESCVVDAVHHGNQEKVLSDLNKALENYIR